MRIGVTILSLMLLVGLSLAAQTAATNAPSGAGAISSLLRPSEAIASDGSSPWTDLPGATLHVDAVWETIPKPPSQVDRVVHATVYDPDNDKIYMIGGNPAGEPATYLNLCQEYDPAAGTWTTKAPMTTSRGWLPGSFCNGKIYLIGGHNNSSAAIATNECYDPVANSWSTKTARPRIGLAASEAVWRDSLIYVLGGNNASSGFANVDIYDPAADAWTVGTALPLAAFMGSAAIIGDTIFMVQAYSGTACWPNLYKGVIDEMDPTQITWTAGPAPTEPIFNGGTAAMDGDVYWLGGFISAATVTNHLWKYSTSTGAITAVTPNYPTTLARLNFMVARPSAQELYVLAGDALGDWTAPNQRYYRISFAPPLPHDVALSAILAPLTSMNQGSVKPIGTVRNAGLNAESNIPVTCWIDSAGTRVYSATDTLPGPLAPGASVNDTFPTTWTSGPSGARYTVTMFTSLSDDSSAANDTMRRNVTITGPAVQEPPEAVSTLYTASPSFVRGQAFITYNVAGCGYVSLGVYDAGGKLVKTLVSGQATPGERTATWNRTDNGGRRVANGTYFYRLAVDGKSVSGKAIVLK